MRKYIVLLGMVLFLFGITGCSQEEEELNDEILDSQEIEINDDQEEQVEEEVAYVLEDVALTYASQDDSFVLCATGDVISEYSEATINGEQAIFTLALESDAQTIASFTYESGQTVFTSSGDSDTIVSIIIDGDSLTIYAYNFPYDISTIDTYTTTVVIDGEVKYNYSYDSSEVVLDSQLIES